MRKVLKADDESTQVTFPTRASWRTFVQALLGALPVANLVLLALQQLLATPPYSVLLPPMIYVIVNATVVASAFAAKLVAALMTEPHVNAWIVRNWPGLAASPQKKVEKQLDGDG